MSDIRAELKNTETTAPAVFTGSNRWLVAIVVLFTLAFAVLDFAMGQGVISHLVNLVGFSILAVSVLRGYSRSRGQTIASATQLGS